MPEIAAMDLFVMPTLALNLLYGFIIVRLDSRELVWIAVTNSPTADWIARQITEAFPWESSAKGPDPRQRPRLWFRREAAPGIRGEWTQSVVRQNRSATASEAR
jgi:hypothetical protein